MGILNIDLNNINLDNNFDEDDPDTIMLDTIILLCLLNLKNVAWHPKRWWNFCMSEDENKEVEPILT